MGQNALVRNRGSLDHRSVQHGAGWMRSAVLASALALSACGGSSDSADSSTTAERAPTQTTATSDEALNATITGGVLDFIAYCNRVTAGKNVSDAVHDKAFDGLNAVIEAALANPDAKLHNNITPRRALGDMLTVAREDCDESAANRLDATIRTLPP